MQKSKSTNSSTPTPTERQQQRQISPIDAIFVGTTLLLLVGGAIALFGSDSLSGATQIAMIIVGFIAILVGMKNGFSWREIEQNIIDSSSRTVIPILIFLAVGSLIASLMLSGAVPTLLYAGLKLLSPTYFYPLSCILSALVALCIGSSWTTVATIGIGLIGVSFGFQLSVEITAGAIISGAYFGDKMSPLSETTNLAPAIAGSDLFAHIRHMTWVSIPSFFLAVLLFFVIGLFEQPKSQQLIELNQLLVLLDENFAIGWYNLIPIALLLGLAIKKVPAFLAIISGTLAACLSSILFQPAALEQFIATQGLAQGSIFKGLWIMLYDGFKIDSNNQTIDALLSKGGMVSMLKMAWLVTCSMMMAGVLEKIGFIQVVLNGLLWFIRSTASLIAVTMSSCLGVNLLTGDQYLSIVIPGQMWKSEFQKRKLAAVNLSRSLEDAGTLTSPLIPWNACGIFMASSLGVSTFYYLPFCFFNLINPCIALIFAFGNIKILAASDEETLPEGISVR